MRLLLCALLLGAALAQTSTDTPDDLTTANSNDGTTNGDASDATTQDRGTAEPTVPSATPDPNATPGPTTEAPTIDPNAPTQPPVTVDPNAPTNPPAASSKAPTTTTTRAPRPTFEYETAQTGSAFVTVRNLGGNGLDPTSVKAEIAALTTRIADMRKKVDAIADSFNEVGSPVYKQLEELLTQVQQADALLAQQQTALQGVIGDLDDIKYEDRFEWVEGNVKCFAEKCSGGPNS